MVQLLQGHIRVFHTSLTSHAHGSEAESKYTTLIFLLDIDFVPSREIFVSQTHFVDYVTLMMTFYLHLKYFDTCLLPFLVSLICVQH